MCKNAVLALADGTLFEGRSVGAQTSGVGEVVFNTAMTGYQEILTDPSYLKQIVTFTAPQIGNTGVNAEDTESSALHVSGVVLRDLPFRTSNFRREQDLPDYLADNGIAAIAGIDTRRLTRIIRERGAQPAVVDCSVSPDGERAAAAAREFAGLQGMDLAREVSVSQAYEWNKPSWQLGQNAENGRDQLPFHVVAYDFGIKRNILRLLVDRGCKITVVPAQTSASEVLAMQPDGVFLSNGPGDPEPCDYAISAIAELLAANVPLFGICLGHQLLALAAGARTMKMKFGHHGANHPVQDIVSGAVAISSQNHGFAVDEGSLPATVIPTHRSLFDGTLQGIEIANRPAFGFQGHPEASPGPHDLSPLFDRFINLIEKKQNAAT